MWDRQQLTSEIYGLSLSIFIATWMIYHAKWSLGTVYLDP